jgi:hypothetical protein
MREKMGPLASAGSDAGPGTFGAMSKVCQEISEEQGWDVIFFRDLSHTFHNLGKNSVLNCPTLIRIWNYIKKTCAYLTNK